MTWGGGGGRSTHRKCQRWRSQGAIQGDLVSRARLISNWMSDWFKVIYKWVTEEILRCERTADISVASRAAMLGPSKLLRC